MNKSEQKRYDELYRKHLRALKFRGMSDKTIDSYSRAVRRIAAWFDCCPNRLEREQWAVRVFPRAGCFIPRQRRPRAGQFALAGAVCQKAVVEHPGVMGSRKSRSFVSCARPARVHETRHDPISPV